MKRCVLHCRYDVEFKQEAFYTGGRVQVTTDGTHLLTTCREAVKVLDLSTGLVVNTLKEVKAFAVGLHSICMCAREYVIAG